MSGPFAAPDHPLYGLEIKLYVRCSPENPNRIYLRSRTTGMFVFVTLLGLTGLLIWAVQYIDSRWSYQSEFNGFRACHGAKRALCGLDRR